MKQHRFRPGEGSVLTICIVAFLLALLLTRSLSGANSVSFEAVHDMVPVVTPVPYVDINHADTAALCTLPGIGEALAERIIAYRNEHGAFTSVDELENVSGIGESKLEEIRLWAIAE